MGQRFISAEIGMYGVACDGEGRTGDVLFYKVGEGGAIGGLPVSSMREMRRLPAPSAKHPKAKANRILARPAGRVHRRGVHPVG